MSAKLYKVTGPAGESIHGGAYQWPLPRGRKPGAWAPSEPISLCLSGYHLTREPWQFFTSMNCRVWVAEGCGNPAQSPDTPDKRAYTSARLLREVPRPVWLRHVDRFLATLPTLPWLHPDNKPLPEWRLFTASSWNAARDAAWNAALDAALDAAWNAAWDAAWDAALDAARDAALMTGVLVSEIHGAHEAHAKARMQVWQKGYALLCDVNGVLYVYAKKA